jgi:hypothetical protein
MLVEKKNPANGTYPNTPKQISHLLRKVHDEIYLKYFVCNLNLQILLTFEVLLYKKVAKPICPTRKRRLSSFKEYGLDLARKRVRQLN